MGEGDIEENIIQPMWSDCEERFRLRQEKLESMKEDVIQRNVENKLSKVREVTAMFNKKIAQKKGKFRVHEN